MAVDRGYSYASEITNPEKHCDVEMNTTSPTSSHRSFVYDSDNMKNSSLADDCPGQNTLDKTMPADAQDLPTSNNLFSSTLSEPRAESYSTGKGTVRTGGRLDSGTIVADVRNFLGFSDAPKYPSSHLGGDICAWCCFFGHVLTLTVFLIFFFDLVVDRKIHWKNCDFFTPANCNVNWRDVFSLNPITLIDIYTPLIFALLGLTWNIPRWRVEKVLPSTWWRFGWYMLFLALFANFGYASEWGAVVGIINCLFATLCWLIYFTMQKEVSTIKI